jgi:hypothetical protein
VSIKPPPGGVEIIDPHPSTQRPARIPSRGLSPEVEPTEGVSEGGQPNDCCSCPASDAETPLAAKSHKGVESHFLGLRGRKPLLPIYARTPTVVASAAFRVAQRLVCLIDGRCPFCRCSTLRRQGMVRMVLLNEFLPRSSYLLNRRSSREAEYVVIGRLIHALLGHRRLDSPRISEPI